MFGKQGKILHSQTREIIENVLTFVKKKVEHYHENNVTSIPIVNYKQRVTVATGISEKMHETIIKRRRA
ncbi:hypothetical protein BDFB_013084 [Asbolus verrucosus]|uniref:Uncharacterized protein n=1 Tax=Asbolus verrucosus TaxID=1661398 RepID=A0A482VV55_ASBVE|nr:hypothetical protein BDFB_013084 [Asbolus verrucosus]